MSYILEALRRAEAERQAGSGAPQSLHATSTPAIAATARSRWPLAIALLLVLVLAAALGAWLARRDAPLPAPLPAPSPSPEKLVEWPRARLEEPPAAAEAPRRSPPATQIAATPRIAVPAAATASAAAAPTASAPTPGPVAMADTPAPRLAELPAAWRQQLPPLRVGGSMHSPEPALRSLILNGQLYREGDAVGPDLRVERIDVSSAVLRFKGQAFVLSF